MSFNLPNDLTQFLELVHNYADNEPKIYRHDFRGLINKIIEEAYELEEAYEADNEGSIREELGDLIFLSILFSIRAHEKQLFSFKEVIKNQAKKLYSRNIFLQNPTEKYTDQEVKDYLNKTKAEEPDKVNRTFEDSVPKKIPPFQRCVTIQNKAAQEGYDWENSQQSLDKLNEELEELKEEVDNNSNQDRILDEMGDVLFSIINYSRFLKIDPSSALAHANKKFVSRMVKIQDYLKSINKKPEDFTTDELNKIWQEVKNN